MRIAIFTDTFIPLTDGVVTFITNLSKELVKKGHKVFIICPKYKDNKEFKYKNIKVIRINCIPAFFYEGYKFASPFSWSLLNIIKREKIDIIHFQTPISLGIQAILISKILKIPLVGTFHTNIADPNYLRHVNITNSYMQKMAWEYSKIYYNQADLRTCPSETTKKELLKHGFKKPIKAISNGIDLKVFKIAKNNKKQKNLIFIGRIAYEKNIFYLLDCFKMVLKKIPNTKLIIVGDGPQFVEVKDKVKSMNLSNKVILTGKINHNKLINSPIFNSADLFVTASTTETQGISTMEAQAKGIVSIGISAGGIKDLIKNNHNGFLVKVGDKKEFADSIIKLLSNKFLYKKMRTNTLEEIKKHDMKKVIKIYEKEYETLIKNKNRS